MTRKILGYVPTPVRRILDGNNLWLAVAYIGIVGTIVGLFFVNARSSRAVALQAAASARSSAEHRAAARAEYQACVGSIPTLHKINRFVGGQRLIAGTLLRNAEAAHAAEPPHSALYRQQVVNIARLRRAVAASSGVEFPAPTRAACKAKHDRALRANP